MKAKREIGEIQTKQLRVSLKLKLIKKRIYEVCSVKYRNLPISRMYIKIAKSERHASTRRGAKSPCFQSPTFIGSWLLLLFVALPPSLEVWESSVGWFQDLGGRESRPADDHGLHGGGVEQGDEGDVLRHVQRGQMSRLCPHVLVRLRFQVSVSAEPETKKKILI